MREIFATIKINETSSPLSLSFLSFAKQGKTADGQKRTSTDTVLFPPPRQGLQQSLRFYFYQRVVLGMDANFFNYSLSPCTETVDRSR